jgi:hypothetical protein
MVRATPRAWLGASERAEALVGCVTDERFQPEANSVRVGFGARCRLGLLQEALVDVECLFPDE